MLEMNKIAFSVLTLIKENIKTNKSPLYNPVLLKGLDKKDRFRYFWSTFNKDFNQSYKDIYQYVTCEEIDMDNILGKKLVIIENVQEIEKDLELEIKLIEIVNYCVKENIQLVICSDIDINDLGISELSKSKLMSDLIIHL